MRYGSVCSGIESATTAWHPLGWEPQWLAEIKAGPNAVLAYHYPNVPNLGDMTKIHERPEYRDRTIDLLVGGTPCQSFSIAGLHKGLADPRGNLALQFLKILDDLRPRWVVWENVPGVLSSWSDAESDLATAADYADAGLDDPGDGFRGDVVEQTNDFDTFLCGLRELGYGVAWRVLDAQYFNMAQRRERVFVVGYLGDWRPAAAVFFEPESMRGDPAPSRQTRKNVAGTVTASAGRRRGSGQAPESIVPSVSAALSTHGGPVCRLDAESETFVIAGTLNANGRAAGSATQQDAHAGLLVAHALRADGFDASEDGTGRGTPIIPVTTIAFHGAQDPDVSGDVTHPLGRNNGQDQHLFTQMRVRRLTPRECERLQGFPDDYTKVPRGKKMASDGMRYKALGNAMNVACMRWIGERIDMVEKLLSELTEAAA